MKKKLFTVLLALLSLGTYAQNIKLHKTINLHASVDFFQVKELGYTSPKTAIKSSVDTSVYGTDFFDNVIIIKTDLDSVTLKYDWKLKPYGQRSQINIITPRFTKVLYYDFHDMRSYFSKAYMDAINGKALFENPETYELANILFALTNSSKSDNIRTYKGSDYYQRVQACFGKYKNLPLITALEAGFDKKGVYDYFNFRENSFCYKFDGDKIVRNNIYNIVYGELSDDLFGKYLPLINDFVKKTGFRKFYEQNKSFYTALVKREQELMPVKHMQEWLEKNISKNKINTYRIVFSPLIKGSHSTQSFSQLIPDARQWFKEDIMFVSGPEIMDHENLSETRKTALASGVVFTEIDHNYCNPVSDKYRKAIDSAMSQRSKWISVSGDGSIYDTPMSIFNEYITHGAFILYCYDTYKKPEDFTFIKDNRERLMADNRMYIKFRAFSDMLLKLYKNRKENTTIADLYPEIINWCRSQN